jgi:hypothetical protein
VSAFEASKYKITNEQFLEFVLADGYRTREFWSNEGWEWVQFKQASHPLFWVCPMQCKSGCGSALAPYTHCQARLFTSEQLRSFSNEPSHQHVRQFNPGQDEINVLDENGNQIFNNNHTTMPFK